MSTIAGLTVTAGARSRRAPAVRARLDVAEWLVLRAALHEAVPGAHDPPDFTPAAFGLPAEAPLTAAQHARAWAALVARGLAAGTGEPGRLRSLSTGLATGLLTLRRPTLQVDVSGWSEGLSLHQSIAWAGGRTVALARRRRAGGTAGQVEQEPVVDLALAGDSGLLPELWRSLPGTEVHDAAGDTSLVRVGWQESAAVAHALRSGRSDVAAHLSGLPPEALALLGSVATTLRGATSVTIVRAGHAEHAHRGVWLWTASDVVELLDATRETVTLRRSSVPRLRSSLLSAITDLLHAEEEPQ